MRRRIVRQGVRVGAVLALSAAVGAGAYPYACRFHQEMGAEFEVR
jgi:plastocyanin